MRKPKKFSLFLKDNLPYTVERDVCLKKIRDDILRLAVWFLLILIAEYLFLKGDAPEDAAIAPDTAFTEYPSFGHFAWACGGVFLGTVYSVFSGPIRTADVFFFSFRKETQSRLLMGRLPCGRGLMWRQILMIPLLWMLFIVGTSLVTVCLAFLFWRVITPLPFSAFYALYL